jgi:hypothetical protein
VRLPDSATLAGIKPKDPLTENQRPHICLSSGLFWQKKYLKSCFFYTVWKLQIIPATLLDVKKYNMKHFFKQLLLREGTKQHGI